MKLGILGGTFDPVHKGHINIAKRILDEKLADKIIFIPNGNPPHKMSVFADAESRYRILELALSGKDNMELSDIEMNSAKTSYTYQTLEKLKKIYPNDKLLFICGADNLSQIKSWRKPELIFKNAGIIFISRPEFRLDREIIKELERDFGAEIYICENSRENISSGKIREMIKNKEDVKQYIPEKAYECFKGIYLYSGGIRE